LKAEENIRGVNILLFHILQNYDLKRTACLNPAGYASEVQPITWGNTGIALPFL
jgi:hypothetical protein